MSETEAFRFFMFEEDGVQIGQFSEPDTSEWENLAERFDDLLDGPGCDRLTYADFEHECRGIISKNPLYLDAYAHIAMHYLPPHPIEDVKAAARWYRKGFKLAMELVPEGFSGRIEWANHSNRPFLRIHHGLILCALRQKRDKEAIALMEQHLAWNPDDNIGVRYLIGEAYLRRKMTAEARKVLEDNATHGYYPPSVYSLALLDFFEGRLVQALTWLRRGIAENPYIAEALNGRIEPLSHARWHGSNYKGPDVVENYLEQAQGLWRQTPFALAFLDWAFNNARGLRERADFAEVAEALAREHAFDVRGRWVENEIALLRKITEKTSLEWLETSRFGASANLYPWERKDHRPQRRGL